MSNRVSGRAGWLFMASHAALILGMVLPPVAAVADMDRDLARLAAAGVPFAALSLPATGELVLAPEQSLTIDRLRGRILDPHPPVPVAAAPVYDPRQTDTFAPGAAPYVASGIEPFRLTRFVCEFNYGGWHNFAMTDYAATHGFSVLSPYVRKPQEKAHLPPGTTWLAWGGLVNWDKWLPAHGIDEGRYDRLMDLDVEQLLVDEKIVTPGGGYQMIDMEHACLAPDALRKAAWYPATATEEERRALEKKYYDGYARTYIAPVAAARRAGRETVSLYGWAPYGRTWGGLEKPDTDTGEDFAWNAFGRQIYESVDLVHNSVYCFYWSAQNVAYTLANIDRNLKLMDSMPQRKPLRPYYWTLLHGGGPGWRWWQGQPLPDEEQRALTALAFFAGIDGFDCWNWSGKGSHHAPPDFFAKDKTGTFTVIGQDLMIGTPVDLAPVGAIAAVRLPRYGVIHLTAVDPAARTVQFQLIRPGQKGHGVGDAYPVFTVAADVLAAKLRMKSAPVAAMIEGMALVKPFEDSLRNGVVKIDVPADLQFRRRLPISRRVQNGNAHLIATYDPGVVHGGAPRRVVLDNFAGRAGLTVSLPADEQVRIFVLQEPEE